MWKLIFLALTIWFTVFLVKRIVKSNQNRPSDNTHSQEDNNIENMVQCNTCHVHLPRSEAYLVNGKYYCSKTHINVDVV